VYQHEFPVRRKRETTAGESAPPSFVPAADVCASRRAGRLFWTSPNTSTCICIWNSHNALTAQRVGISPSTLTPRAAIDGRCLRVSALYLLGRCGKAESEKDLKVLSLCVISSRVPVLWAEFEVRSAVRENFKALEGAGSEVLRGAGVTFDHPGRRNVPRPIFS